MKLTNSFPSLQSLADAVLELRADRQAEFHARARMSVDVRRRLLALDEARRCESM